jgi:hypothetical protein
MSGIELSCHRCGGSLCALSLPLSRRDLCPECSAELHVCRMCEFYDPAVPKQCREDDAEEVMDKERANFCDWFRPSPDAFDAARAKKAARAEGELAALFGEDGADSRDEGVDDALREAEKLFR